MAEAKEEFERKRKAAQGTWFPERDAEGEGGDHDINEDVEAVYAKQDQEDAKEDTGPIRYTPLGGEDCPIEADMEVVEYCSQYRIPKLEGLDQCTELTVSMRPQSPFQLSNPSVCLSPVGPLSAQELD